MISLAKSLQLQADAWPERIAVIDEFRHLSYQAFGEEVSRLATILSDRSSETPVGILIGNRIEHLSLLIAADQVGVPVAPLDPRWSGSKLSAGLALLGITFVVATLDQRERLQGYDVLFVDDVTHGYHPQVAQAEPLIETRPVDGAIHLYGLTGGTSGRSKAVSISRSASVARIISQIVEFGADRDRRFLAMTPLFHGAARSLALAHLWVGASVHLEPEFSAKEMMHLLSTTCHTTFVVPTMVVDLLEEPNRMPESVRFICSGAPLIKDVVRKFQDQISFNLYNYFASVEAGGIALLRPEEHATSSEDVGHPIFGTHVEIVAENGSSNGVGVVAVRGPSTCSGVISEESETFEEGSLLLTGDRGSLDALGRLTLHGRKDDVIITGGVNVDPSEVERALLNSLPEIESVMVVGMPDRRWGQKVVAAFTGGPGKHLELKDVKARLRGALTSEKRPKEYVQFETLPTTRLGKPDRKRLAEILAEKES